MIATIIAIQLFWLKCPQTEILVNSKLHKICLIVIILSFYPIEKFEKFKETIETTSSSGVSFKISEKTILRNQ